MFLHEQRVGTLAIHGDVMDAVADFGGGIRDVLRVEPFVDGLPGFAAVVGSKRACSGDGDDDALGIAGIENDGVQAHAAGPGLPLRAGAMAAECREFLPGFAPVFRTEYGGVFNTGIDHVGLGE